MERGKYRKIERELSSNLKSMKTFYKMEPTVERLRVLCTIYKQNNKMMDNHFIKFF